MHTGERRVQPLNRKKLAESGAQRRGQGSSEGGTGPATCDITSQRWEGPLLRVFRGTAGGALSKCKGKPLGRRGVGGGADNPESGTD